MEGTRHTRGACQHAMPPLPRKPSSLEQRGSARQPETLSRDSWHWKLRRPVMAPMARAIG